MTLPVGRVLVVRQRERIAEPRSPIVINTTAAAMATIELEPMMFKDWLLSWPVGRRLGSREGSAG